MKDVGPLTPTAPHHILPSGHPLSTGMHHTAHIQLPMATQNSCSANGLTLFFVFASGHLVSFTTGNDGYGTDGHCYTTLWPKKVRCCLLFLQVISPYDIIQHDGQSIHPELLMCTRISSKISKIFWLDFPNRPTTQLSHLQLHIGASQPVFSLPYDQYAKWIEHT